MSTLDGPSPGDLAHLETVAALGFLLNAIAHDLNNQLTNLMFGADQAQYSGDQDAIDLMVAQAQNIATITRAIQTMGQRNLADGADRFDLSDVVRRFAGWHRAANEAGGEVVVDSPESGLWIQGKSRNVVLALSLLARSGPAPDLPLRVSVGTEEVPRSAWAGNDETVVMATVRLTRGGGGGSQSPTFKALVDDFFASDRDEVEIGIMAAWEILRKIHGRPAARMEVCGDGDTGHEILLTLPLAAD